MLKIKHNLLTFFLQKIHQKKKKMAELYSIQWVRTKIYLVHANKKEADISMYVCIF